MAPAKNRSGFRTEIIESPALYCGSLEVTEDAGSRGRRLSGTRFKSLLIPFFYWLIRHTPVSVALLPVRLIVGVMGVLYVWRNNPLRLSCEYICHIAANSGYQHDPAQIYRQYLANVRAIAENYFQLYRYGIDSVADRVEIPAEDGARIHALRDAHGGLIITASHNLASAFSALKMNRVFPVLLVARNPSTIARTRAALDIFDRMEVKILMVRGGNPFELSRAMFAGLKDGKVICATLDNIDHSEQAVAAQIFGQKIGFPSWAARIATRRGIPMVPSWYKLDGTAIRAVYGEALITDDLERMVAHSVAFFERTILEDPANWAYLGDRRWRRVLRKAVAGHDGNSRAGSGTRPRRTDPGG